MSAQTSVRDSYGLSLDRIQATCPSVFAEGKHESRSDRYTYIPTSEILVALRECGFLPTAAMQAGSRIEGRETHTKHLLRLRHQDDLGSAKPDVHEVVLRNSHDGTSAYDLFAGVFRVVCTNGLITGDIHDRMKVYHKGNVVTEVVESTLQLAERSEEVMDTVARMKATELTTPERLLLAEYTMKARFDLTDDEEEKGKEQTPKKVIPYQPESFLQIRRNADRGNDLYRTMNVLQENALRGGVTGLDVNNKRKRTRPVHGIGQTVEINTLVWQFAQELLKFKQS